MSLTGFVEPYAIKISPFTCTIFIVCLFALVFKGILVLDSKMQLTAGKVMTPLRNAYNGKL